MAAKKSAGRFRVLRDYGGYIAGDTIDLDAEEAALLIRDGIITPAEEA